MSRVECEVCGHEAFVGLDPQTKVLRETLRFVQEQLFVGSREAVSELPFEINKVWAAYPADPNGGA